MQEGLHQLPLVWGSWEGTVTKCLGATQSIWQWKLQGGWVPRGGGGNRVLCLFVVPSFFLFCQPLRWLVLQVEPTHRPPVVSSHASLWPLRWLLQSAPATCRSCKMHHIALSPLMPLAHARGPWPPVACTRSAQSPLNEQESSLCL